MISSKISTKTLIESTLLLLLLFGLLFAVFKVLEPFFGVLLFALILSVSFSKPYNHLVRFLKDRRKLAAVIYVILLLAIFTMPFIYVVSAISEHFRVAIDFVNNLKDDGMPTLPDWIVNLPMVGEDIREYWQNLFDDPQQTVDSYGGQIKTTLQHVLAAGKGLLGVTLQFILGVIISAFFLVSSRKILFPIKTSMERLLGEKAGNELVVAIGQAIKGVSIGVMGTALIASFLSWLGFTIAGVPFAIGFAAIVFFLVVIQIGPLVVWIPIIIWYATLGETGWTIFLIVYAIVLIIFENVIRPVLIARSGGRLPFLVLFIGVLGGMFTWGFIGMFKGAIIMAIFYTIYMQWLRNRKVDKESV